MDYRKLTDRQFVELIFLMGDRLETDYVDEAKRRRASVIPMLCDIAKEEKHYRMEEIEGWGVVHAVYILGILADHRAMDALLTASGFADQYGIDWIWDALPECYLRIGPSAIPALKMHIRKTTAETRYLISSEVSGLWNIWHAHPDTSMDIEDFLLEIIKSASENYELRSNLIADFALIKRHDLRPLFEEYYENGEVDLNTLSRPDLDYFYDESNNLPGFRFDLEAFYNPEEVAKRQERWAKEDENRFDEVEELILENFGKIGRNESCPCGSGKKFKKCHLTWAQEELEKVHREDLIREKAEIAGQSIQRERHYEAILRRFLASKGKTAVFNEMKETTIEATKRAPAGYQGYSALAYLNPFLMQIAFGDQKELEAFLDDWAEYHDALAEQYAGHPKNDRQLH